MENSLTSEYSTFHNRFAQLVVELNKWFLGGLSAAKTLKMFKL